MAMTYGYLRTLRPVNITSSQLGIEATYLDSFIYTIGSGYAQYLP